MDLFTENRLALVINFLCENLIKKYKMQTPIKTETVNDYDKLLAENESLKHQLKQSKEEM